MSSRLLRYALGIAIAGACAACGKDSGSMPSANGSGGSRASVILPMAGATAGAAADHTPKGSGGAVAVSGSGGAPGTQPNLGGGGKGGATAGSGGAAGPMGTGGTSSVPTHVPDGSTCLQAGNGQYTDPGPYKVATKEVDLGMIEASQHTGKFTIYYPDPLEASCPHPIVGWGNGTGVEGSGTYAFLNSNAASWGMVVAEAQEDNTGSGAHHKAGIDYLLKENADPASMFYQKLSTRAATSGHSQGGFGASAAASHPNVVASVIEGASNVSSEKVSVLVLTGTEDIVMNPETLVTNAKGPMFVANWEGGDHFSTETLGGYVQGDKGSLQFTRLYAAWLRCFLADDSVACKLFSGGTPSGCGICKDMGWHSLSSSHL